MPGKFAKTSPPQPGLARLPTCAHCLSHLLQLEAWRELPGGCVTVRLRCPECGVRMEQDLAPEDVARLDDAIAQARVAMVALHTAVMRENMEREAVSLAQALALDLIGPDDFARGRGP